MSAQTNRWIKIISTHGNIRGVGIQATELVRSLAQLHSLRGEAAQGLGEAVMGAMLLASYCKPGERVNLNIRGSLKFKQALVDAYPDGSVRGYLIEVDANESAAAIARDKGPWGDGLLSVLRTKSAEQGQPYIGTVPLLTGYLAKDLTFYWVQSEQIPSAVGLAVNLNADGIVASAGGFLVQALPGANDREVRAIEQHINDLESLAAQMTKDMDPIQLLSKIFQDTAFVLLEEKPLRFECSCSWQRVERALALVGVTELTSMLSEDNEASVRCDFCTKQYRVDAAGLEKLILRAKGD